MTLYRGNNILISLKKNVCSMLRLEICEIFITNRNIKNNLLCSHSHYCDLRCNPLGNLSYAKKLFMFQKEIIRIITNTRPRALLGKIS